MTKKQHMEQQQQNPEINQKETELLSEKATGKKVLFIGSPDKEIIDLFINYINSIPNSPDFEISVLGSELYLPMLRNWELSKLDTENRQKMIDLIKTDEEKQKALEVATYMLQALSHPKIKKEYFAKFDDRIVFTPNSLKVILDKINKPKTHTQIRQLIDFLLLHGYLQFFGDVTKLPKHKIQYELVIDAATQKRNIEHQLTETAAHIAILRQRERELLLQRKEIAKQNNSKRKKSAKTAKQLSANQKQSTQHDAGAGVGEPERSTM